jgi:hypothetical protein
MKKLPLFALGTIPLLGLAAPAAAQDAPPQMYFVIQEHVKPSMTMEYEAASKDFIKMLSAAPIEAGSVQFQTIMSPEMGYTYAIPVQGFSGVDKAFGAWEGAMRAVGEEKWMAMDAKSKKAVDYYETSILAMRPDLSYNFEGTAISGDMPFRKYFWWHVIPGKELEAEAVAKEYAALYRAKEMEHGFRIYQAVMGPDLPMYLVVQSAKNEAEFTAREQGMEQMLGEEGMKLQQKSMAVTRKMVIQEGWVRPDLSFPQPKSETGGS